MYTEQEMTATFDTGYECGQGDERKRHERLTDGLQRLNDAVRASEEGDPCPLDDLAREVGVMPAGDAEQLVDEVERWLRDQ